MVRPYDGDPESEERVSAETHDSAPSPEPGSTPLPTAAPTKYCFACGAAIDARAEICPKCGVRQPIQAGMPSQGLAVSGDATTRTGKSKLAASLIAIFLGGLGIHKFYLGDTMMGVVYLLFFWTLIPAIIGLIEGIIWLTQSNDVWLAKYGDR
jgi:TM2 domain-containing membrane protein YozV